MGLNIKKICKEKNISLAEVAQHIGISPISLSQSLNNNPTLSRLQQVASALGVEVDDLFDKEPETSVRGCIYVNGEPVLVKSKKDIENLLHDLR